MYFSGQGKLFIAPILPNGKVGSFYWVGNVPAFSPKFNTTKLEHKESHSGQRLPDKVITLENKATVEADFEDWNIQNLALAVRGSVNTMAAGQVTTPIESDATLKAGQVWTLPHQKLTNVVITDSAGTPATLTAKEATIDADFGTVTINDVTALTLPLKATYDYGQVSSVAFFTEAAQEVAVRFEGLNTADGNRKVLAEIYRVSLDPTKELGLISNDLAKFSIEGTALIDATKPKDAAFGQFGRLVYLD